ncbi:MAG TPA: glycoside hydrolase family 3 N-terminal domain-containing protein [Polyangia bacterium]
MSQHRLFFSASVISVGLWFATIGGCTAPSRGNTSGTAGNGSPGTAGDGSPGAGGMSGTTGSGGDGSPGAGGQGNEVIIISGSAGMGGTTGSAGNGTPGTAGNGAGGAGGTAGNTGAGGSTTKMACPSATSDPLPYTSGYTPDTTKRSTAMSTATAMSDADKAQQMTGLPQSGSPNYNVFKQEDNTTRSIRGFYFRDGPRGVNLNANSDSKSDYSTAFPVAIARGAAFDDQLENQIGIAIGDEMVASGNTMMLAPTVNILRHPAWGRAQETYGEDVFLLGRLGSAFVNGVQQYAAACAKHYAANNIENGRETAVATMASEQTLREVYARHFGMIVQEGGVSSIMASYNQVGVAGGAAALHSTQSAHLLTDILRSPPPSGQGFGFQGFVLSDWWAMPNSNRCCPIPDASTLQPTALQAVQAGLDMELPWRYNYSTLTNLVTAGQLTSAQLAAATARILEQKYRFNADKMSGFGLKTPFSTYDSTSSIANNNQPDPALNNVSHIALAQKAAEESMVLLKNGTPSSPVLPIKSTMKNIAVVGAKVNYSVQSTSSQDTCSSGANGALNCMLDFTNNVRTGDLGSSRVFSDPGKSKGPIAGIMAAASAHGATATAYNSASAAASADFIVVIAGLTPQDEGEEYTGAGDRTSGSTSSHAVALGLDPKQNSGVQNGLIASVAALGKPFVVVLEGGSVIDMSAWYTSAPAVLMAWYPGMVGGTALGRILFGDVVPSGKLPITWDANLAHWPTFASDSGTTSMDYYLGYRYFEKNGTALTPSSGSFPFGYGLSYASFTYHDISVPCSTVPKDGTVNVTVQVTNTGTVAASETVLLFASWPGSTVGTRAGAYKELKGYKRTGAIPAGATALVPIPLRVKDLKYWDAASSTWKIDSGMVKVIVAPNAASPACTGAGGPDCYVSDTFTVN